MIRSSGEVAGQGAGEGRQNGHSGFINDTLPAGKGFQ